MERDNLWLTREEKKNCEVTDVAMLHLDQQM
jgi:hypothetical protein